ncbi:dihydropteroate synthase [Helicobacter muridarum]|uniref:dihydropteroate synthase n=1 Tax=Helicobacter muridarum TaxID=216 RepID=A0A099U1P5_9HELI|nr:dihydropteroate synthase [Helicobacter muridarum]TLE00765.1 dihydropteroate synthase [Helicobacter muridarum]STQ86554.1 dihydropteroate synthase [Helicobacter muridarum]
MQIERVKNLNIEMQSLQPDLTGYTIMKDKSQILGFKIYDLRYEAVQILKQNALSLNAELVTPKNAILGKEKNYNCLLLGTPKSLKLLISKLSMQPFGLKTLAKNLHTFLHQRQESDMQDFFGYKIMSIINVNSDSFYKEYSLDKAIMKIYEHIELGADIIDIGAVSTRPNAKIIPANIELERLKGIFNEVKNISNRVHLSIDTYNSEVAQTALDSGFNIINDVSGKPENMLDVLKNNSHAIYILTHTRGTSQTMQNLCHYDNLIAQIDAFFQEKLLLLHSHNCRKIIIDVGIGFAKDHLQSTALISKLMHFKHFSKPLLIGASHKSFLRKILNSEDIYQLESTLLAHFFALQNGANILRVHDLVAHKNMLKIFQAFKTNDIDMI